MQKPLTCVLLLALTALLSSPAAGQPLSTRGAARAIPAVIDAQPKPWGKGPDTYTFSVERTVGGTASESRADEQKRVGEVMPRIMREHGYKDYDTIRIDAQKPTKNRNTYYVRFFKVSRGEDELAL